MVAYHQKFLALPAPKPEDAWRNHWYIVATYRLTNSRRSMYRQDVYTSISRAAWAPIPRGVYSTFDAVLVRRFGTHYDFPLMLYEWRDDLIVMDHHAILAIIANLQPLTEKTP